MQTLPFEAMPKRPPRHTPSEADRALFEAAIGPVRRLESKGSMPARRPPKPHPRHFEADEARVMDELLRKDFDPASIEIGEELVYLKDGHSPLLLKRLRRGQLAVADEIDLHQMNAATAEMSLKRFLDESRRTRRLCVKVIHGKGLRSKAKGPVLKKIADRLLRRRDDVLAFASARAAQGGTGATLVLLTAPR